MTPRARTESPLLPKVLRVLADPHASRLPAGTPLGELELEWLLRNGLGPQVHRVRPPGGFVSGARTRARIQGADLTSRALTHHLLAEVEGFVARLNDVGITPTVLKGVSYATRHYPEPHLRTMGDVDLLIADDELALAKRVLLDAGFVEPPTPWRPGHHAPPLHHAGKQIWVELHYALRPAASPEAREPPLNGVGLAGETRTAQLGEARVHVLGPECELGLLATEWCSDLKKRFRILGKPRALVDAVYLLRSAHDNFDWDRVMTWSSGSYTGACIGVLLTYLQRQRAYVGPSDIPARIVHAQPFVRGGTLRAVHGLIDRYVVRPGLGRLATPNTVGNAFDALIEPRPAWRSLLAVPVNVVFPAGSPHRFRPRFMLARLRRALSGR